MISRNREHCLQLFRVHINRDNTGDTRTVLQEANNKRRRNRYPRFVFAILPQVGNIGENKRDAACPCQIESVDGQKAVHQILVRMSIEIKKEKDVFVPDVLHNLWLHFLTSELGEVNHLEIDVRNLHFPQRLPGGGCRTEHALGRNKPHAFVALPLQLMFHLI